jgi:hypothetical protein
VFFLLGFEENPGFVSRACVAGSNSHPGRAWQPDAAGSPRDLDHVHLPGKRGEMLVIISVVPMRALPM